MTHSPSIVIKENPPLADMGFVLNHLRACDHHEFRSVGLSAHDGLKMVNLPGVQSYCAYWKEEPVFVFGVSKHFDHTRGLWGWGTERTWRVMPEVTRWVQHTWLPNLFGEGVLRIEARVPQSCEHSIKWLQRCGMYIETELKHAGILDEPYVQLAYTISDHLPRIMH